MLGGVCYVYTMSLVVNVRALLDCNCYVYTKSLVVNVRDLLDCNCYECAICFKLSMTVTYTRYIIDGDNYVCTICLGVT